MVGSAESVYFEPKSGFWFQNLGLKILASKFCPKVLTLKLAQKFLPQILLSSNIGFQNFTLKYLPLNLAKICWPLGIYFGQICLPKAYPAVASTWAFRVYSVCSWAEPSHKFAPVHQLSQATTPSHPPDLHPCQGFLGDKNGKKAIVRCIFSAPWRRLAHIQSSDSELHFFQK